MHLRFSESSTDKKTASPYQKRSNSFIDRVLIYNLSSVLQLQSEHFDTVINLEKVPGLCALADQIIARRRYGFCLDVKTGDAEAYPGTENVLQVCQDQELKKNHSQFWQEHLFEMVGTKWRGEEYLLGYQPKKQEVYDVGFNFKIGYKFPGKAWADSHWQGLEDLLKANFSISWQKGLNDMEEYFEWIQSCRLVVTNDSFGLHLALALKKKVVALYGPTNPRETHFYGRGIALTPDSCGYFYDQKQSYEPIDLVRPDFVAEKVSKLLRTKLDETTARMQLIEL